MSSATSSASPGRDGSEPAPRAAALDDLAAIADLEARCFAPHERFPPRRWRALLARPAGSLVLVAGAGERLLAAIAWLCPARWRRARLYSLAVHPEARGRGLARRLIAASLERLPERCTTLSLEVRADNGPALALYAGLGFVQTARLPDYYAPGQDGLRLAAPRAAVAKACAPRG